MNYRDKYDQWINSDIIDEATKTELKKIKDEKELEDRFYKDLEFGTGGLRGVIGAGSNRLNIYTVGKATQGFSDYLNSKSAAPKVAIAYDSRHMSREFSEYAARVLAANNVKVYLYDKLTPTPMLSYAVRDLQCDGGIVITASHNPKEYNGYKVYGSDGCQVTDIPAGEIIEYVNKISDFGAIKVMELENALKENKITYIGEEIYTRYIDKVKKLAIRKQLIKDHGKELKIIYTPLHGSGNVPVRRVLKELFYENVMVVKEQELPDGDFPTAPYPNPEDPKVFKIALSMAEKVNPDIIMGTDPDCDRIGVVVKDNRGEYRVLSGNQVGVLLAEYIISAMKEEGTLPHKGTVIKTIVSTDMVKPICKDFGVELIEVLTGFKYIGETIKGFEDNNETERFIMGFEESYGYLAGGFVRDKDAVIAASLICEMTLYYKLKGKTLYEGLMDLYDTYGYYKEKLVSIEQKGKEGQEKIKEIIDDFRNSDIHTLGSFKAAYKEDYKLKVRKNMTDGSEEPLHLPQSNVIKYIFDDGSFFVVRPSGTEPKMKVYIGVRGDTEKEADENIDIMENSILEKINKLL